MAWRSHGSDNVSLVDTLARNGLVRTPRVKEAMLAVDRGLFSKSKEEAYHDNPHGIGFSVTISAPHMHASCLEALQDHLYAGARVLDVGSGSGYLTACMGVMVKPDGVAYGIEHVPELVSWSEQNMQKSSVGKELVEAGNVVFVVGDGRKGLPEHAPFDCIHVGAASPHEPRELMNQLKVGGRLIVPVGTYKQEMLQIDRVSETQWKNSTLMGVQYVPLTDLQTQLNW